MEDLLNLNTYVGSAANLSYVIASLLISYSTKGLARGVLGVFGLVSLLTYISLVATFGYANGLEYYPVWYELLFVANTFSGFGMGVGLLIYIRQSKLLTSDYGSKSTI